MVRITIELIPDGDETQAKPLGKIVIVNDGTGTETAGNYTAEIGHTGRYIGRLPDPYKVATVKNFNRRHSIYALLQKVLAGMRNPPKPATSAFPPDQKKPDTDILP